MAHDPDLVSQLEETIKHWKNAYQSAFAREQLVRDLLGAQQSESTNDAAKRVRSERDHFEETLRAWKRDYDPDDRFQKLFQTKERYRKDREVLLAALRKIRDDAESYLQ